MANTEGGFILLGIEEIKQTFRFSVFGIQNTAKVIGELWSNLNNREKISSNILNENSVQIVVMDGKQVIQVSVPRATRSQMPVFVGKNPFEGTYRRQGEGDFRCDTETVKRMLADNVEDARDSKLLEQFTFEDISMPTFLAYRRAFKSVKPDHPWADVDHIEFLRNIGGWLKNRNTERSGVTLAGLLMFGKLPSILEAVPHYILDYQERPPDSNRDDDRRWIDRITTDGTWSGNLFDFFGLVMQRLARELKVPFKLKGHTRTDDTPVHEAVREALVNTMIHADFTGRVSIYIVKRPDMIGFRNPGLMRVPLPFAIQGGNSDCRNRAVQRMFQLVGLAEQAGSGLPKVYRNWGKQHWRRPELIEQLDPDQTILRLRMVSLLPEPVINELDQRFGKRFRELPEPARLALATVVIERSVTHARLKEMCDHHPKDLSKVLADLVTEGFLVTRGATRGTIYYFSDTIPDPTEDRLVITGASTISVPTSSQHLTANSQHLAPVVEEWAGLLEKARPIREKGRASRLEVRAMLVSLCTGRFLTAKNLGTLLDRDSNALLNHYIRQMVSEGDLELQFADRPSHPHQAYRSKSGPNRAQT